MLDAQTLGVRTESIKNLRKLDVKARMPETGKRLQRTESKSRGAGRCDYGPTRKEFSAPPAHG